MSAHLVTGVTGLVGGAIALELLARTDAHLHCLVRGDSAAEAEQRLTTALTAAAVHYGRSELIDQLPRRVTALWGDITRPLAGVAAPPAGIEEVWHCAASLRYEERYREEILEQNVAGTVNVLDLARAAGARRFNQVSTAYVAGRTEGTIREEPADDPAVANNCYEESKIAGERAVLAADDLAVRILRPSIVVGHSETRWASTWSGLYGFTRQLLVLQRRSASQLGTFLLHTRLRLVARTAAPVNLVPVDHVARDAVSISLSDSPERFFHLTAVSGPTIGDAITDIFEMVGLRPPIWVTDPDDFTALDQALDQAIEFYRSYVRTDKVFDRSHTDAVVGADRAPAGLSRADLRGHLLQFLTGEQKFDVRSIPQRTLHAAAGAP
ncbi:MAG TPA: SDR family oxidoreductase [Mycobacteriales bacterium]|jgi:thioester reductase-like protein|nr:SDR family oxidoreductase [Mycobacteriales bacterium]